ncbi:alpha/beta hydrolase [Streptomyces sp. NPDC048479]|uniref:alpha/beta hydrolase n=1 Tax=Streptomyces sp. NPDC048479 TaxID=3154725 RepID=UPI003435AFB5
MRFLMGTAPTSPTVMLIHGLWMTPLSWEKFAQHFESRGHTVQAPAWPGLDGGVATLYGDPRPLEGLGITEIVDHYERLISELDQPPILIGHSFGGLIVQLLLDRQLGAAGVAIDPAAPKGVLRTPLSTLRSCWPVLSNPANRRRAVPLNLRQFTYAFANTLRQPQAQAAYDRYSIPGSGRMLFQSALANLTPNAATTVDYRKSNRAPLLLIAGGKDHIIPPALVKATARKYRRSTARTDYHEFPGRSHLLITEDGWQEVADHALDWAIRVHTK